MVTGMTNYGRTAAWASALILAAGVVEAQERIELATRPGVTELVYITVAATEPKANVILFPGHGGVVAYARATDNFLLRVAPRFVAEGITVAMIDPPSDQASGMSPAFRTSANHVTDIATAVASLKSRSSAPVWLVGISLGAISAAQSAAMIGSPRIAGVVLTSSPWQADMKDVAIEEIRLPVLVVHNRDDGCGDSLYEGAARAMERLQQATVKELLTASGGLVQSGPCDAQSPHGFYGIEDQVVPRIIGWIESH
jgi:hypothetical protein